MIQRNNNIIVTKIRINNMTLETFSFLHLAVSLIQIEWVGKCVNGRICSGGPRIVPRVMVDVHMEPNEQRSFVDRS